MKKDEVNLNGWRTVGLVVAGILIIFGGVGNLWRTLKYSWERLLKEN